MTEYELHPVCLAFPEMGPEAYEHRLEDYRQHSERAADTPVLLARDEADGKWKIADGRHHYRICRELGYEFKIEEFSGTPAELVAIVKARNINRRHQTPSQIAAVIAALQNWEQGGDHRSEKNKTARAVLKTQEETAKSAGISADTLQRASKVAKKSPDLLPAMRDGKLDATTAAKVAGLPDIERKEVVESSNPKQTAIRLLKPTRPEPSPRPPKKPKSGREAFGFKGFDTAFGVVMRGPDALKAAYPSIPCNAHTDLVKALRNFRRLWDTCVERVTRTKE